MKKLLSFILAVVMLLGCISITAFAEDAVWEIQGDTVVKYTADIYNRNYTVPDGVKGFGNGENGVFEGRDDIYQIRFLTLPASITTIAENALAFERDYTVNIRYLCVGWTNSEDIPTCPYMSPDSIPTLIVPNGMKELYKSKDGWKDMVIRSVWEVNEQGELEACYDNGVWGAGAELVIPNDLGIKKIKYMALGETTGYAKIVIPEGVIETERGIIANDVVTSVTLPKSLATIAERTLGYTSNISEVIVSWDTADSIVTPANNTLFTANERQDAAVVADKTLYVPYGTKVLYEAHPYWSQFGNIVELSKPTYQETIYFNEKEQAESEHFILKAHEGVDSDGWNIRHGTGISIEAKTPGLMITGIDIVVSLFEQNFSYGAQFSSGEFGGSQALEGGGRLGHIINIKTGKLLIYSDNSRVQFKDVTVYYEYHDHEFTGDLVNNGDGTHSVKCANCDDISEPVNHTFTNGECACGASIDDVYQEIIFFGETGCDAESNHYTLKADRCSWPSGWIVSENSEKITIKPKADNLLITKIEAALSSHLYNYGSAHYSAGEKAETGAVEDVWVHVNNINSEELVVSADEYLRYQSFVIFYKYHEHDFTGEYTDNGDGTHTWSCFDCGKSDAPEVHNFINGECVCGAKEVFRFDSKNLALDSALAFRFKGYLYDENPAEDAYMEFKIGDIRTEKVALKDAVKDDLGRYVFTCYLNVLEVDEKIDAIFHDGDTSIKRANPLSVTNYLDSVLERHQSGTEEDIKTVNLINAISNFAHYTQIALDETHTDYTVGENGTYHGTAARSEVTMKTVDDLSAFKAEKTVATYYERITSSSRSLVLDDETALVIYLTPMYKGYWPESIRITDSNGKPVEYTADFQPDGKIKIVIRGIAAHMLGDTYKIEIDDIGIVYTNLSALSYAYSILGSNKSDNYKYAVSALYDYYLATVAYMN